MIQLILYFVYVIIIHPVRISTQLLLSLVDSDKLLEELLLNGLLKLKPSLKVDSAKIGVIGILIKILDTHWISPFWAPNAIQYDLAFNNHEFDFFIYL